MRKIVNDWMSFCEGKRQFNDGYFFTLFMDDLSNEEMEKIFQYFPNSETLYLRMKKFKVSKSNVEINVMNKSDIENLLIKDFKEREKLFKALPYNSIDLMNHKFVYTNDFQLFDGFMWDDIWTQGFFDFVESKKILKEAKVYVLNDALYGVSNDLDLRLFLFEPLLSISYNMDYIFDFKMAGGVYAITESEVWYTAKRM